MQRKRKKVTKYRGSHTHGGGSKKKRRGAGHRGGRGNAGSGKRADQKKPKFWKEKYFSGPPFKSLQKKPSTITIAQIETRFENLQKQKIITEKDGFFEVSFKHPWKLLSQGNPSRKYFMKTSAASKTAMEKISKKGGKFLETKPAETTPKQKPVQAKK